MSTGVVEIDMRLIAETAIRALEEFELILETHPEMIDSLSIEEVRDELSEIGDVCPPIELKTTWPVQQDETYEVGARNLDVETNITVQMRPVTQQNVRIRIKNLGPAKLHFVHEPDE